MDETAESLREMAQHRGLKLVRSRRRKAGTGDFGKYGLTDEKGTPLLGISDDGLTASATDIEEYLRAGAASTWQQSAQITPERNPLQSKPTEEQERPEPARDQGSRRKAVPRSRKALRSAPATPGTERAARRTDDIKLPKSPREKQAAPRPVEPDPILVLRPATSGDASELVKVLGQLSGIRIGADEVAANFAAVRKAGGGIHVAEFGTLIGCVGWTVIQTIHRGPIGRLTVLVVDERHRRRGVGTRLLAEAEASLAKKGCGLIEVMSDIDIKNSHNFFRTAKFEQVSYRFTRKISG